MVVFATYDDMTLVSSFFRWRWKSFRFSALWRHKLQWRHICSRHVWVSKNVVRFTDV